MKPIYCHFGGALALTFAIAACVPAPDSTPAPSPTPSPMASAPAPTPTPTPHHESWMDAPQSPGDWTYRTESGGSVALFGEPNAGARFTMRCNRANGTITLWRASDLSGAISMRIRTETVDKANGGEQTGEAPPGLETRLSARDPILDAMALTRGRFAIETGMMPTLYLPAWAEVTRVIEDCR